jgi:hypothetical protein
MQKGKTLTYKKKGRTQLSVALQDYIEIGVFMEDTIKDKK